MSERRRAVRAPGARPFLAGFAGTALALATPLALAPSCLDRRAERADESSETRCATCHGDPARPGEALLRAAPPRDLLGASGTAYPGVGAHAIHLYAGKTHGRVPCSECHRVPERVDSPGHADDGRPAELVFGPLASRGDREPHYDPVARTCDNSWCHRDHADAVWSEPRTSQGACGSCHGLPPPLPHPQSERCEVCHGEVIDDKRHFINPSRHVDGMVQAGPGKCSACHGEGEEAAPPADTRGNQTSAAIGVGALSVGRSPARSATAYPRPRTSPGTLRADLRESRWKESRKATSRARVGCAIPRLAPIPGVTRQDQERRRAIRRVGWAARVLAAARVTAHRRRPRIRSSVTVLAAMARSWRLTT
jgi:hypothetical protein